MKQLLAVTYQVFNLLVLLTSSYFAAWYLQSHWLALALMAAAPLLQWMVVYDKSELAEPLSRPSQIRLPLVSLLMMLGTAWLLLAVPAAGLALWLGFACLGGFILNTYWIENRQGEI